MRIFGYKISPIFLALLVGLLIAYVIFQIKKGIPNKITGILESAGFSKPMARWWVVVSALETGIWTSNLFKNYNNLFGMMQPVRRPTTSIGSSPSGFASFSSQTKSVEDLVKYLEWFNYPKSFGSMFEMVKFMKNKGYFTISSNAYNDRLIKIQNKLEV